MTEQGDGLVGAGCLSWPACNSPSYLTYHAIILDH